MNFNIYHLANSHDNSSDWFSDVNGMTFKKIESFLRNEWKCTKYF